MTGRARTLWIFILVLVRRRELADSEESRGSESGFESERTTARGVVKKAEERMSSMMGRTMDRTSTPLNCSLLLALSPGPTAAASSGQ